MPHISLRVTEEEKRVFENYASLHGIKLSEALKQALIEKIEDEFDLKLIREYEAEPDKSTVPFAEITRMLQVKQGQVS